MLACLRCPFAHTVRLITTSTTCPKDTAEQALALLALVAKKAKTVMTIAVQLSVMVVEDRQRVPTNSPILQTDIADLKERLFSIADEHEDCFVKNQARAEFKRLKQLEPELVTAEIPLKWDKYVATPSSAPRRSARTPASSTAGLFRTPR